MKKFQGAVWCCLGVAWVWCGCALGVCVRFGLLSGCAGPGNATEKTELKSAPGKMKRHSRNLRDATYEFVPTAFNLFTNL